jgi:hypothetical protein
LRYRFTGEIEEQEENMAFLSSRFALCVVFDFGLTRPAIQLGE